MLETSTAPGISTSGVACALRHKIASDIGMGFELALKCLAQGLSSKKTASGRFLMVTVCSNLARSSLSLPGRNRERR